MQQQDQSGLILSGASPKAAENYREALSLYHCYVGDPLTLLDEAIADSPGFAMAHVLKAYMLGIGTEPQAMMAAAQHFEAAKDLPGSDRERAHIGALGSLLAGELHEAARILEDVTIEAPRDGLALQVGQVLDFLVGDSRMLRDRIARALPDWSKAMPDYHAVLGMLAFGLEETGHYARAEACGRLAVDLQPRNGWAQHAVAHVLEMEDRRLDGLAWMRADTHAWSHESFFAVHNWWHLALFHLGLGEVDEVLKLYDGPIYGQASPMALDMVDASALLWRLHLQGVEVTERWGRLADVYEAKDAHGLYAFDDFHAAMAFVGAGRTESLKAVLDAQGRALAGAGDNVDFVRDVGLPVIEAIQAFGAGDYAKVTERLRPVRNRAARFGGSHAQRDLIDLTLIEAARRGGDRALEQALVTERSLAKPLTPIVDEAALNRAA